MNIWRKVLELCASALALFKAGTPLTMPLSSLLKQALKDGYAQLGAYLPTAVLDGLESDCYDLLSALFTKFFCDETSALEARGQLDEESAAVANGNALRRAALRVLSAIEEGIPCAEVEI